MAITDDVSWPLEEQLVVEFDQLATEQAIEILEDAGPDRRVTVQRVLEYARGDRPSHEVADADWIKAIEHSDGRLALVSWTSAGITEIGQKCDAEESRRPFEVWLYSGLRESMGDEPIETDDASRRGARQLLEGRSPTIVTVWETHLRPEVVADGGNIETVADLDPEREVYYTAHTGGPQRPAHLDPDCRHLDDANQHFHSPARTQHPDRDVCKECAGTADYGTDPGTDVKATRKKLSELNPGDVGLSALGERGSAAVSGGESGAE